MNIIIISYLKDSSKYSSSSSSHCQSLLSTDNYIRILLKYDDLYIYYILLHTHTYTHTHTLSHKLNIKIIQKKSTVHGFLL